MSAQKSAQQSKEIVRQAICAARSARERAPEMISGALSVSRPSGHLNLTLTCSSLPPSVVLLTVIVVPEPATLVDAQGLSEDQ